MKIFHWIKSLGRAIAFLPVCLFVGVSVNAADLSFEVIAEGDGETAQNGMQVSVHYQGRLTDGTIFDDSQKRGTPFSFTLGSGQVIPGWEQGIAGMKIGEKRVLTIPPELGYGAAGAGGVIPPNATLVFDVELVAVAIPPKLGDATAADLQAAQKNGVVVIDIRRAEEWAETGNHRRRAYHYRLYPIGAVASRISDKIYRHRANARYTCHAVLPHRKPNRHYRQCTCQPAWLQ